MNLLLIWFTFGMLSLALLYYFYVKDKDGLYKLFHINENDNIVGIYQAGILILWFALAFILIPLMVVIFVVQNLIKRYKLAQDIKKKIEGRDNPQNSNELWSGTE